MLRAKKQLRGDEAFGAVLLKKQIPKSWFWGDLKEVSRPKHVESVNGFLYNSIFRDLFEDDGAVSKPATFTEGSIDGGRARML
jgi:hypothetical protein